jgi:hypothetical protein
MPSTNARDESVGNEGHLAFISQNFPTLTQKKKKKKKKKKKPQDFLKVFGRYCEAKEGYNIRIMRGPKGLHIRIAEFLFTREFLFKGPLCRRRHEYVKRL